MLVENGYGGLDAAVQVAAHPVGRRQIYLFASPGIEVPDAGMLEVRVDDARHVYVAAVRLVGYQAVDAAHQQVDVYACLAGIVEGINHARVVQAVHFQNDVCLPSLTGLFHLETYFPFQLVDHVELGHEQRLEIAVF